MKNHSPRRFLGSVLQPPAAQLSKKVLRTKRRFPGSLHNNPLLYSAVQNDGKPGRQKGDPRKAESQGAGDLVHGSLGIELGQREIWTVQTPKKTEICTFQWDMFCYYVHINISLTHILLPWEDKSKKVGAQL